MREFTESIVREHLAKVTAERDITVTRIDRIPDDVDRLGRPFTARQRMLQIWEARLRAARLCLRMTELATSGVSCARIRAARCRPRRAALFMGRQDCCGTLLLWHFYSSSDDFCSMHR